MLVGLSGKYTRETKQDSVQTISDLKELGCTDDFRLGANEKLVSAEFRLQISQFFSNLVRLVITEQ